MDTTTRKCSNCLNPTKQLRPFTHHGVTSHVCWPCFERLTLAQAAFLRYSAILGGALGLRVPRPPRG